MFTIPLIPRAAVRPRPLRPLQQLQVPTRSGDDARCTHSTDSRVPCRLEQLHSPALSGAVTGPCIPRGAVLPRPLQHLQTPALGGHRARPNAPWPVLLPRPPQHLQLPAPRSERTTSPDDVKDNIFAQLLRRFRRQMGSPAPATTANAHDVKERERNVSACRRRHQALALGPVQRRMLGSR